MKLDLTIPEGFYLLAFSMRPIKDGYEYFAQVRREGGRFLGAWSLVSAQDAIDKAYAELQKREREVAPPLLNIQLDLTGLKRKGTL